MVAGLRFFSKRHLRRAGRCLRLSTSGILSDQKAWGAPDPTQAFDILATALYIPHVGIRSGGVRSASRPGIGSGNTEPNSYLAH